MASSPIDPANTTTPKNLIGGNYDVVLHQSIRTLVNEAHKETPNFSQFIDKFYELMQAKTDPPIETIWVYCALSFKNYITESNGLSSRISTATKLFQLVSCCSSPCSSPKSIALLAPVVFEVYKLVVELISRDLCDKKVKKLIRKVQSLIGLILGFISVCCGNYLNEDCASDSNSIAEFENLVALGVDGKDDGLVEFLPLVSDVIRGEVRAGKCSVKYLAGVVIAEVLLLKLCLDIRIADANGDAEKELKNWAVLSISGIRSCCFFEILVEMLLDSNLPVSSLLNSKDETFLRKILYDVTILPEYYFLDPERAVDLSAEQMRSLAMKRLIMISEAVEFVREKFGDQKRAISYTSSFTGSRWSSQMIKWVMSQIGASEETSRLSSLPPKSLLKWLWNLKRQGIVLFDDSISKYLVKFVLDDTKIINQKVVSKAENKPTEGLFYIDNKGDQTDVNDSEKEGTEAMSSAFVTAAHTLRSEENGRTKRKGTDNVGRKKRMKLPGLSDDSDSDTEQSLTTRDVSSNSESEVENPNSDEDN